MVMTASPQGRAALGHEPPVDPEAELRSDLVVYAQENRQALQAEWLIDMGITGLLDGLTPEAADLASAVLYDMCVASLESGSYELAETYASDMAKRAVQGADNMERILVGMMTLRDVRVRSLLQHYADDQAHLQRALGLYEPVANRILLILAMAFPRERERVMSQQQDAIRELSTPVLQVRDRMLILPIIGLLDSVRARQLTEQLLQAIRSYRARVVVMDVTGVAAVDSKVANHIIQTVEAARLLGATVIVTGVSAAIAQTIVTIGVDLSRVQTVGDLQGGIEMADRLLGYRVIADGDGSAPAVGR